eukprot:907756-Prymnesium_polylepis.2
MPSLTRIRRASMAEWLSTRPTGVGPSTTTTTRTGVSTRKIARTTLRMSASTSRSTTSSRIGICDVRPHTACMPLYGSAVWTRPQHASNSPCSVSPRLSG